MVKPKQMGRPLKNGEPMIKKNIRFPVSLWQRLERDSEKSGETIHSIIFSALKYKTKNTQ